MTTLLRFYNNLRNRIKMMWCTLRKYYRENKLHFILCFSCSVCGILIALSGPTGDSPSKANFLVKIAAGESGPLGTIFQILLFTSITYFVVFTSSFHFGVFVVSYGGITIGTSLLFRCAFASVTADGFLGILFLILFIIPVFAFNLVCVTVSLARIYDFRGYAVNRKHIINLACNGRRILKDVLSFYSAALILIYFLWLILYLIFLMIF